MASHALRGDTLSSSMPADVKDVLAQRSSTIVGLPGPEHFVQFYETDDYLVETMGAFLGAALSEGENCLVVATQAHRDLLETHLRSGNLELADLRSQGKYVALDAADTLAQFMVDGMPDRERFTAVIGGVVVQAAMAGSHVSVYGEMVALLWAEGNTAGAIQLEEYWNELHAAIPCFALCCGYPMHGVVGDAQSTPFMEVCRQHTVVLPDERYGAHTSPDMRLRALTLLQQRSRELEDEVARRRTTEERLRTSEERYRRLFETSTDGILIVDPDTGVVTDANPSIVALMGLPRRRLVGKRLWQIGLLPDQEATDVLFQTLAADQVAHYETLPLSTCSERDQLVEVVGTRFQVDGRDMIQCNVRDVTEQRTLAQRTRDSLAALVAMAEALVSTDSASTPTNAVSPRRAAEAGQRLVESIKGVLGCHQVAIAALNPATEALRPIAIVARSEAAASLWTKQIATAQLSDFLDSDQISTLRAGEPILADLAAQPTIMGSYVFDSTAPLILPMWVAGQLIGLLMLDLAHASQPPTAGDLVLAGAVAHLAALVVERERLLWARAAAEAEALALQEANRQMNQFLSLASHELKTPLTVIKANIGMAARSLRSRLEEPQASAQDTRLLARLESLVDRMSRGSGRLERLVDDLLDVSRMQSGTLDLHLGAVNLAEVVREAITEQRQVHPARTIALEEPAGMSVLVEADGVRIEQVITNLLTNALKYSPSTAAVTVGIERVGKAARVFVQDEGPGLPPEECARVWDLYYRVPGVAVQSGSGVGLGLGLHICKTIVERHGGQVGVESAQGIGSTFWFTLPLQ